MSVPEEAVIRWGSTLAFLAFFSAALYMVGATFAPWIGAFVAGVFAARLWVKHAERVDDAKTRAEVNGGSRLRVSDDDEPAGFTSPRLVDPDDD